MLEPKNFKCHKSSMCIHILQLYSCVPISINIFFNILKHFHNFNELKAMDHKFQHFSVRTTTYYLQYKSCINWCMQKKDLVNQQNTLSLFWTNGFIKLTMCYLLIPVTSLNQQMLCFLDRYLWIQLSHLLIHEYFLLK